jgi:hypothetical protein
MGVSRPEAQVFAYLALRITFADARAREGAPAGLRRGLDCCSGRTAGAVKVDWFRPTGQTVTAARVSLLASPIAIGTNVIPTPAVPMVCCNNVCVGESPTFGILAKHSLLQEVDVGCRRSGCRNVARRLAAALHMNWLFAGEFQEIGQGRPGAPALTGQAILSRYALSAPAVLPFPHQARLRWRASPWQPRRGARMALRAETAGLRVYSAHIESGKNDAFRRKQLAHLAGEEEAIATSCTSLVIAGDFNCGPSGQGVMLDMLYDRGFVAR